MKKVEPGLIFKSSKDETTEKTQTANKRWLKTRLEKTQTAQYTLENFEVRQSEWQAETVVKIFA